MLAVTLDSAGYLSPACGPNSKIATSSTLRVRKEDDFRLRDSKRNDRHCFFADSFCAREMVVMPSGVWFCW
jgi:hypothetical protein